MISIRAYNAGHSTFGYRSEGFAGLIFAARLGRQTVVSDASWKCLRESGTRRDTVPYSLQLPGHQEATDLRVEHPDWETVSFDDSAWGTSEECRPWNAAPYFRLEARGTPLMREFRLQPKLIGFGAGESARGWESTADLAGLRLREKLTHEPARSEQASFRIPTTRAGDFRSFLLDFGRVVVGSVRIAVNNAAGGETLDFLHTEARTGAVVGRCPHPGLEHLPPVRRSPPAPARHQDPRGSTDARWSDLRPRPDHGPQLHPARFRADLDPHSLG